MHHLKVHIVQKLIPKLQQEGYVEVDEEADATARSERRAQEAQDPRRPFGGDPVPNAPYPHPGLLPDLARPRPAAPVGDFPPPGFEDEHEIYHPPRGGAAMVLPDGRSPFNIGHDDLYPPGLGPHDPLRGSFPVGGGRFPSPGGPGGMYPSFDDPLFGGQGGGHGFGEGGGFDPQAPPGARWDPIGPGRGPRFGGPGGGRFGGGGGEFGGGGHII